MLDQAVKIPTSFYILVGTLVVGNIGVLITFVGFIFKAGMFVSDTKQGIAAAKDCSVRAHKRIDMLELIKRGGT